MPPHHCFLSVQGLVLDLFVGCLPEERDFRQSVEIDFDLFFLRAPQGCVSDRLADTVCYARCIDMIRETANKKHFNLIEHLAFEIHAALTEDLPKEMSIRVRVTKIHPPIPELKKGVSFTYG